VESIKQIQPRGPPPRGLPGRASGQPMQAPPRPQNVGAARGAPAPSGNYKPEAFQEEDKPTVISRGAINRNMGAMGAGPPADPKDTARSVGGSKKQGIAPINTPVQAPAGGPSDFKGPRPRAPFNPNMTGQGGPRGFGAPPRSEMGESGKQSRPGAPHIHPAGIPDGASLPPDNKFKDPEKFPPASTKMPPDRGRAPPRVKPGEKVKVPDPEAPDEATAPTKRGKVVKVEEEVYVPRRERDNPEFESSSSDEDKKSKKADKPIAKKKEPVKSVTPAQDTSSGVTASAAELKAEEEAKAAMKGDATAAVKEDAKSVEIDEKVQKEESDDEDRPPIIELDDEKKTGSGSESEDEITDTINVPPTLGVSMATSQFVPPPPEVYEPNFDTSNLSKLLTPGRLSVKCIGGINVRRKDEVNKVPKQDPFLKMKLGAAERFPYKSSSVVRKADDCPDFGGEIISFDVLDPRELMFNGDIQITIECWNKGTFKEESMGSISLSVVRFMQQPFMQYEEKLPLLFPGQKTSQSKVHVSIVFEEARPGIFEFTLFECRSLRNVDAMGSQHPYVNFKLGPVYNKKSKVIQNGGTTPYFGEEQVLMWADNQSWKDDLQISILDQDLGEDKPIGSTHFSLLSYMNDMPFNAKEEWFDLFYYVTDPKDDRVKQEFSQGEILMRVAYYPAGKFNMVVDKAKGLAFPETYKQIPGQAVRMDPYVKFVAESKTSQMIKRTAADKDGGGDPVWNETILFDIVDQYQLNVEVLNQSAAGSDTLLGYCTFSLLSTFRSGKTEQWLTLKQKKASGGIIEVGSVFVICQFQGPTGISYPQLSPEVDSFDDTVRALPAEKVDDAELDKVIVREPYATVPGEDKADRSEYGIVTNDVGEEVVKQEFADHEILAAFKFIDLDHNNFIGAREIRHILVCMGEMITDEEIDCMISMVDMDGDGQVSFQEFRTLVLHPDPGMVDMHKEVNKEKDNAANKERQAASGKAKVTDLSSYQRQKELTTREGKKKQIIEFITENDVNLDYIKQAYQNFLDLPREKRPNGRIRFQEFCDCLGVEALTENKVLHSLFDNEEMGDMDFRELLLGMMNFIDIDKVERIQFSFIMFDELKTGYISHKEVEEILRGNHMIGILSVQRKADTVMRQASANAAGSITMNEFVVVSKKFPNILLPALNKKKK
jgi:Ca2+-binding EF-hand superfamily protein